MKLNSASALNISLHWDSNDIQPVGRLAYRDRMAFLEYDETFLAARVHISPVHHRTGGGLHRPDDPSAFAGLHGVFNDSLPDGWGRLLVDRRALQLGIDPATLTPLDRLACVGCSGIGALCYEPVSDVWQPGPEKIALEQLATDAGRVLAGDASEILSVLGQVGGSPGGARPKALVAINENGHAIHGTAQIPEDYQHYLVKFPGPDDPVDIAAIELAYGMMARDAGVITTENRLLGGNQGNSFFASKRFDRHGSGRVHVHSACGLLYSDIRSPALDYKDLILLTRAVTRDRRQCKAMFRLAVFNVLAHNRDDHARQFSFIMARDGTWTMAPAYDLTWSQGPGGEQSCSVMGHGRDITQAHLIQLARQADLNESDAAEIINQCRAATAKWPLFAAEAGVGKKSIALIGQALAKVRV